MDNGGLGLTIAFLLSPFALVLLVTLTILLVVPLAVGAAFGLARRIRREPETRLPSRSADAPAVTDSVDWLIDAVK